MDREPILLEYSLVESEILQERVVNEAKGDVELDVKVRWQREGVINSNGRLYPKTVLQREIERINESIKNGGTIWGHPFHPKDGFGRSDDISHMWTKVWMNKEGWCEGTLTVLPTTSGKNIQTLVRAGRLGMSSRGFGTTTEKMREIDGKSIKYLEVNDDYKIVTPGDWVVSPSVKGAQNLTEEINTLESSLNEGLDSVTRMKPSVKEKNLMSDINNVKELKESYPQLVQEIEAEKEKEFKDSKKASDTEDKITELENKINEHEEKISELEDVKKALEEWKNGTITSIRELISSVSEIEGVLPEGDLDSDSDEGNAELEAEVEKLKKDLTEATAKISEFEADKAQKAEDEKKVKEEKEKQEKLSSKLQEVMAKDEYKDSAALIEEEVKDSDGNITIESVDAVEDKVKAILERINKIRSTTVKDKIVKAGIEEKGKIDNPEGGEEDEEAHRRLKSLYKESVDAGFSGDFEEWREKYPSLVETVKS